MTWLGTSEIGSRDVHAHLASPQDLNGPSPTDPTGSDGVEGGLRLLQARPMTALPDPVEWTRPAPGYCMRNLGISEWLPEPMTPLLAD